MLSDFSNQAAFLDRLPLLLDALKKRADETAMERVRISGSRS
jgi:hypothetical protein